MIVLAFAAALTWSPPAAETCAAADDRGIVTSPATQTGEPNKAIRKPSAHKGDYLPTQARVDGNAAGQGTGQPTAVINTSRSNVKSQRIAVVMPGQYSCERAAAPGPGPRQSTDCDDTSERGLVTPAQPGTTNVDATAPRCR